MTLEFVNEHGEIRPLTVKERFSPRVSYVRPLQTGDTVPFFSVGGALQGWQAVTSDRSAAGQTTSVLELVEQRPLVISFYCPCWGAYARPYLDALVALAGELRAAGADLVVFSNESSPSLARQIGPIDFTVVYDADFSVARTFGVYSEENPIWDRVSGISEEVFTPALYVVGADRRVSYHFLDEDFNGPFDRKAVIDAVLALPYPRQQVQFA
ncbi:peroxiredoxin [Spirosoma lacussanchae]|uniref:peroxiredoxin family protein n=1 Tax=Spirosoma lacussanchae TaxID=1884249 RepID=UPI001109B372|nr:redoxin domain-containing protein [Spirosoma lacussanchae]